MAIPVHFWDIGPYLITDVNESLVLVLQSHLLQQDDFNAYALVTCCIGKGAQVL